MRYGIEAGEVGQINSAQAKWIRRTGIPGFGGWFTNKEMSGPLIDLLRRILPLLHGLPEAFQCACSNFQ